MFRYGCMNPIAEEGLCRFPASAYEQTDKMEEAQGILVRSASLHDMDFSKHLLAGPICWLSAELAPASIIFRWTSVLRRGSSSSTRPGPTPTA